MRPDSGARRRLLRGGPSPQWDPAFSSGGRWLAFRGYYSPFNEGDYALYVSGTNGCGVRRLTGGAVHPTWSPDGRWLAFDTAGVGEIWKVRRDGTGRTRIAALTGAGENWSPAWSPDGSKIAFVRFHKGRGQIWLMQPDGTGKTVLRSDVRASDETPAWSRNGRRVAFEKRVGQQVQIASINADGSNFRTLTNLRLGDAWNPVWLPHDLGIAFLGGLNGNGDLYVMRPNGEDIVKIASLATFQFAWTGASLPPRGC